MTSSRSRSRAVAALLTPTSVLVLTLAGCSGGSAPSTGSAPTGGASTGSNVPVPVESNPPGDIPDNLAFVAYDSPSGGYTFTHPEGWAQTVTGTAVRFTDKLNGVAVESVKASAAPTVAQAKADDVARLKSNVPAFKLVRVEKSALPSGAGIHIVFRRNSDPDPVTGKVYRDEVEEYIAFAAGRLVRMDLYGPVGADNVDAYRTMSQSLRLR